MKVLFFLVAFANVTVFMWEYNIGAFEQAVENSDMPTYSGQERIVLVNELKHDLSDVSKAAGLADEDESDVRLVDKTTSGDRDNAASQNEIKSHVAEMAGEKSAVSCYEAGPFAVGKVYEVWDRQLTSAGAEVKPVSKEDQTVEDYLVFYPAAENMTLAEANLVMLKNQGIKDLWMVRKGDEKGQILLGIFNREERAVKMKAQMQAKGIDARIKARYKNKSQKYALIKGDSQTVASLEALKKTYPTILTKSISDEKGNCQWQPMENHQTLNSFGIVKPFVIDSNLKNTNEFAGTRPQTVVGDVDRSLEKSSGLGQRLVDSQITAAGGVEEKSKHSEESNAPHALKNSVAESRTTSAKISDASHSEEKDKEPRHCYQAGPFVSEKLLGDWQRQLTAAADADIKILSRVSQAASDYQVYYPSAETPEQSKANLEMLHGQGFKDAWLIGEGDEKGRISLGVFKKEERALRMKEQMQAKGINVEVRPRYKRKLQNVLFEGGGNVSENLRALEKNYPGITVKPAKNCLEEQSDQ